jgi:hypothetical protein
VSQDRETLRELSTRLLALHKLLLDRERQTYEAHHAAPAPAELFRLVLEDPQFAWLRPLSRLVAQIDDLVDSDEPVSPETTRRIYDTAHRLLGSGERGAFEDRYRDALQDSPDVVMAHAGVRTILRDARR